MTDIIVVVTTPDGMKFVVTNPDIIERARQFPTTIFDSYFHAENYHGVTAFLNGRHVSRYYLLDSGKTWSKTVDIERDLRLTGCRLCDEVRYHEKCEAV